MFPDHRQFRSETIGQKIVSVVCDHCKTQYFYELTRVGVGETTALFSIGIREAESAAKELSLRHLETLMCNELDLVACPKCQWISADLVEDARRRLYRFGLVSGLIVTTIVFLVGGLLSGLGMVAVELEFGAPPAASVPVFLAIFVVCCSIPFAVRSWLRAQFNPNRNYPFPPDLPSGTPPALYEATDPRTGERRYVPAPIDVTERRQLADAEPWAVFRAGQIQFPNVCCICLQNANTTYSPVFQLHATSDIAVPVCNSCSRKLRVRWFALAAVCAVIVVIIAAIVGNSIEVKERDAIVVAFCGVVLTVAIVPNLFCRPYQFDVVRSDRALYRFRAKNRHYTQLLLDAIQQATETERKISEEN